MTAGAVQRDPPPLLHPPSKRPAGAEPPGTWREGCNHRHNAPGAAEIKDGNKPPAALPWIGIQLNSV